MKKLLFPLVLLLFSITIKAQTFNIVFTGNSLFQKWPPSDTGETTPTYIFQSLKNWGYKLNDTVNISVLNQNIGAMDAQRAELKTLVKPNSKNIIIPFENCNTISQWGWSAKQFTNWLFDYTRYCKSLGYEVILPTMWAYDAEWSYDTVNFKSSFRYQFPYSDTSRLRSNQIIRDSQNVVGYKMVDLGKTQGFVTLNDTKNRTIYYDGLHLANTGRKKIAVLLSEFLDANLLNLRKTSASYDLLFIPVGKERIYDLLGRYVSDSLKNLPSGFYILSDGKSARKLYKID
jgi:hypothetical protein